MSRKQKSLISSFTLRKVGKKTPSSVNRNGKSEHLIGMEVGECLSELSSDHSDLSDCWNSKYMDDEAHVRAVANAYHSKSDLSVFKSSLRHSPVDHGLAYTKSDCSLGVYSVDQIQDSHHHFNSWDPLNLCAALSPRSVCGGLMPRGSFFSKSEPKTTPIIVLLLDPFSLTVELLRIPVDLKRCQVQDLLTRISAIIHLDEKVNTRENATFLKTGYFTDDIKLGWSEVNAHLKDIQYDGIICRWPNGQTMINCIGLKVYDIRPYELFLAKPTGMSKQDCCNLFTPFVHHLMEVGVLRAHVESYPRDPAEENDDRLSTGRTGGFDDVNMVLSDAYQSNRYFSNDVVDDDALCACPCPCSPSGGKVDDHDDKHRPRQFRLGRASPSRSCDLFPARRVAPAFPMNDDSFRKEEPSRGPGRRPRPCARRLRQR